MISREDTNNDEESADKWYSCLLPECLKNIHCPTWELPSCIVNFQAKLKASHPSRRNLRKNWRQQKCSKFLGFLFFAIINLSAKQGKFVAFDVVFPAVDVYTDIDAANQHFE